MSDFDSKRFLKTVSNGPGIYAMLDGQNRYLYVGKASDLKKRLLSYFRGNGLTPRISVMLSQVANIETIVTHTESEALLLENNLIKAHRPRYNVVLRDDKSYPYIRLTTEDEYPRLSFYRGGRKEPGRYFGPYPSAASVRETLAEMQKVFPLRQCEDSFFRNRSRPCLQYQIERCTAPCVGFADKDEYRDDVRQAVMFLEGRSERLIDGLVKSMDKSAAGLDFEVAARYRDRIAALQRIQAKQYVTGGADSNIDVVALVSEADNTSQTCIEVMFVRNGRQLGSRRFFPKNQLALDEAALLAAFIPQYYLEKPIPGELLLSHAIENTALLEQALSEQTGHRVSIKTRLRGIRARWVERVKINAADALRRHLAGRATQAARMEALQDALDLAEIPGRIECFDVSHTMGEKTVASCVVFDENGPVKSDYRKFNITKPAPGDDYGAMNEALTRRYQKLKEGEGRLPDLLLIDGGKGQLGVAQKVLEELQVSGLVLVGVAKGEARRPGEEQLFLPDKKRPLRLSTSSPALHLIQQIRDEAHRFAITGHRQRRAKSRVSSPLQEIPGVGAKRRQALLKHMGGMQGVKRAGVEDLARVPGISPPLASKIYEYLHETAS